MVYGMTQIRLRMRNIKLFDRKYNALSRMFFFKCIVTECDFVIKYSLDKIYDLSKEDKLKMAHSRDITLIDHLKYDHGLEFLLRPVYEDDLTWNEDEEKSEQI